MNNTTPKRKILINQNYVSLIVALAITSAIIVYNLLEEGKCISILYLDKFKVSAFYEYTEPLPALRNYSTIRISNATDSSFNALKLLLKPIETGKDTTRGVKIIFDNKITYGQYVETINILLKLKIRTFVPFGDTIFVYYLNRNHPRDVLENNIPFEPPVIF